MPRYQPPPPGSPVWKVFGAASAVHTWVLRRTGGRIGGRWGRAGILVLHHVGARTGAERTVALLFGRDGDDLVLVASRGGDVRNPAWYHNLLAHPDVTVELPREPAPRAVHARVAEGEERERLFALMVGLYRSYATYQRVTDRRIPVVVLEPR